MVLLIFCIASCKHIKIEGVEATSAFLRGLYANFVTKFKNIIALCSRIVFEKNRFQTLSAWYAAICVQNRS